MFENKRPGFISKTPYLNGYGSFLLAIFLFVGNASSNARNLGIPAETNLLENISKIENPENEICPIVLFIEPVSRICIDSSTTPLQLTYTIYGSDGSGIGVWSGPGIIDPENGIFDANAPSAIIGNNVINFTFVENGCVVIENTTIPVSHAPDAGFNVDSPACAGQPVHLTATATPGGIYDWDFDGGHLISGTAEGPYEITWPTEGYYLITLNLKDENGCTSSDTQSIVIKSPLPLPEIECSATTSSITFNWEDVPGATGHDVLLLQGPPGIPSGNQYFVSNLLPGGDSVTIQVSALGPLPCGNSITTKACYTQDCPPLAIDIQKPENICLQPGLPDIMLEANIGNPNLSATWSGNGIIDPVQGIFDPNHPAVELGQNKVIAMITDGVCVYKDSTTVDVFQIPEADAGPIAEINCTNQSVALSGNASGSNLFYKWTGPWIITGNNTLSPLVGLPGKYHLTATDTLAGCSAIDSVVVGIHHNVPLVNAGPDKAITCDSATVTLQGSGSEGYNFMYIWHGPGINSSNRNLKNPVVEIPGEYFLQVVETTSDCYSPKDLVIVEENTDPPPVEISYAIDVENCELTGNHFIGNSIPNGSYIWLDKNNIVINDGNTFQADSSGTYIYLVKDNETGCVNSDTITTSENIPYPDLQLTINEVLDCDTREVILDGSFSSFGESMVYSWHGPDGGITEGMDTNIATAVLPGNYTFTLIDTTNNCSGQTTAQVMEIFNAPVAHIENPGLIDCNIREITLDGSASTSHIDPAEFQWLRDFITISEEPVITVDQPGTYTLIVRNSNNDCFDTTFVNVEYNYPPVENGTFNISPPTCFGEKDAILVCETITGGSPPYLYSIDKGQNFETTNQFYNLSADWIDFVIEDINGCQWDTALFIEQPDYLQLSIGQDLVLNLGDTLELTAEYNIPDNEVDTIIWYPSGIFQCLEDFECSEVFSVPLQSFYARATLIDHNGCLVQDKIKVEVSRETIAYIPNVFSPNGDNTNDKFTIYAGNSVKKIKHFSVYNRWGKMIYAGSNFLPNDPAFGWDGTLNGKPLKPDVFVYWAEVELADGEKTFFKGEVTLLK